MKHWLCDICAFAGFGGLFGGLWWLHPPTAVIVCSVLLLAGGVVGALR